MSDSNDKNLSIINGLNHKNNIPTIPPSSSDELKETKENSEENISEDTVRNLLNSPITQPINNGNEVKRRKINPPTLITSDIISSLPPPVSSSSSSSSSSSPFETVPPSSLKLIRSSLLYQFFPYSGGDYRDQTRLPGPLPISLTKATLKDIEKEDYWVAEKSDGERCVLFVQRESKQIYLIDRKMEIMRMKNQKDADSYIQIYATEGDTVLDAELVKKKLSFVSASSSSFSYQLVIFDILVLNGNRYAEKMFDERMAGMCQCVKLYRDYASSLPIGSPAPPLLLIAKPMYPKHKVKDQIFRHITEAKSQEIKFRYFPHYIYDDKRPEEDKRRVNSNDGIIFTPNKDDYFQKKFPLYKWKWPALNTVDFMIYAPFDIKNEINLYTMGPIRDNRTHSSSRAEIHFASLTPHTLQHDQHTRMIIESLIQRRINQVVVECGYSKEDSAWHIKGLREDKSSSNYLTTVVSTLHALIDDVTSQNVIAACIKNKFGATIP